MNEPGIEPFKRFRWRRVDEETRARHRETVIAPGEIIWPAFLVAGQGVAEEITSMTGVYHYSTDMLVEALGPLVERGLTAVLLFGVPATKGIEQAYAADGIVQQAIPCLKAVYPELEIITDVCLCSYTEDGHCHIGDNDATCELLARIAASHADAGADTVAPSDMMDGRVWYIKRALDTGGHDRVRIMSYAAKYASHYYGPFRDAAECAPRHGDRRSYQMDPANSDEALEEIAADLEEGADAIIVKPALAYLDIVARARREFDCELVAYNVSGEYMMLRTAVKAGVAAPGVIDESLVAIKRAGVDRIITYFAPHVLGVEQ